MASVKKVLVQPSVENKESPHFSWRVPLAPSKSHARPECAPTTRRLPHPQYSRQKARIYPRSRLAREQPQGSHRSKDRERDEEGEEGWGRLQLNRGQRDEGVGNGVAAGTAVAETEEGSRLAAAASPAAVGTLGEVLRRRGDSVSNGRWTVHCAHEHTSTVHVPWSTRRRRVG
jgi:hypothetical protein